MGHSGWNTLKLNFWWYSKKIPLCI